MVRTQNLLLDAIIIFHVFPMKSFNMQQNIDHQNKIVHDQQKNIQKNYRLLKCKGKPFWLSLNANRKLNYEKYKNQLEAYPLSCKILVTQNQKEQQNLNPQKSDTSSLQSLQSYNQNYQQDFQSYFPTIYTSIKKSKNSLFSEQKTLSKKLSPNIKKPRKQLINNTERKPNEPSFRKKNNQKYLNISRNKKVRTEQNPKSENMNITRELYMNENVLFLQRENQKIIRMIQQMRKYLPLLSKNQQVLSQQNAQIYQLMNRVKRATSTQYQYSLEKSRSQMQLSERIIQKSIKKLNSPKYTKQEPSYFSDNNSMILDPQSKIREQLYCKKKLLYLSSQKNIQLNKKIDLYEDVINQFSKKERLQSWASLERRKIFLNWEIQKMKTQFDLRIIQETLQSDEISQQIRSFDRLIAEKDSLKMKIEKIKDQIQEKIEQNPFTQPSKSRIHLKKELEISPSPRHGLKSFVIKKKEVQTPNIGKSEHSQDTILTNFKKFEKNQYKKSATCVNVLPQVEQNKSPKLPNSSNPKNKISINTSNLNPNIRIKKSMFKNACLNQDLQEVIL